MKKEIIIDKLRTIYIPGHMTDIVTAGYVKGLVIKDDHIGFILENVPLSKPEEIQLQQQCKTVLSSLGITISILSHHELSQTPQATIQQAPQSTPNPRKTSLPTPYIFPHIDQCYLVASGKGGVGKSTIAWALARYLRTKFTHVGLADADIYGPSLRQLIPYEGEIKSENQQLIPPLTDNLYTISMADLLPQDRAAAWRGPMATKAVHQLLRAAWPPLNVLIIDTPPGTGDIHISLLEHYRWNGVWLVTTPHHLSLADCRRAAALYRRMNVPILGLIENMSYFIDPNGQSHSLFGPSSVELLASELDIANFIRLPLLSPLDVTHPLIQTELEHLYMSQTKS
jgi:ATP-binding protein involved in chromosome partitioning